MPVLAPQGMLSRHKDQLELNLLWDVTQQAPHPQSNWLNLGGKNNSSLETPGGVLTGFTKAQLQQPGPAQSSAALGFRV